MLLQIDGSEPKPLLLQLSRFVASLAGDEAASETQMSLPLTAAVRTQEPAKTDAPPASEESTAKKRGRSTKTEAAKTEAAKTDPPAAAPGAESKPADVKQEPAQTPQQPVVTGSVVGAPAGTATREQAMAALQALSTSKGTDAAIAALRESGVNRIGELKVEQYPEFIKLCEGKAK